MKSEIRLGAFLALTMCILCLARAEEAGKFTISADEQAIVDLTNAERKKMGLSELKPNARLFDAARKHAANMAKQNLMNHRLDGKGHSQRIDDAGYNWHAARENIAFNQRKMEELVTDWMKSERHKENILARDVTEIGVGIGTDSAGQPYYAQVFASPER